MNQSNLPKTLYIGTMNDAVFVINTPPRPAPVDYLTEGNPETEVYAKISDGRSFDAFGKELVARWNSHVAMREALEAICSEFAQGHPLIEAGRAALRLATTPQSRAMGGAS